MKEIQDSLGLHIPFEVSGSEQLPSCFAVTELATSVFGAVGSSIAELIASANLCSDIPSVRIDQRLSSFWSWD